MKKILLVLVAVITFAMNGKAQSNIDRLSFGFGCLYQNGLDLTLSYEHEGKYHHMWEFFANGYLKWDECASWRSYLPGIILEEFQELRIRSSLQALCGAWSQPLRQCPYRGIGWE